MIIPIDNMQNSAISGAREDLGGRRLLFGEKKHIRAL
jgi:hypothetical protein